MLKRVHVNQPALRANRKDGGDRPTFSIQTSRGVNHAHQVDFIGQSSLVARPNKPLPCGATAWVETRDPIVYHVREDGSEISYVMA